MKTKEELSALKAEVETLNKKLHELSDDELAQVSGGTDVPPLQTRLLHPPFYSSLSEPPAL